MWKEKARGRKEGNKEGGKKRGRGSAKKASTPEILEVEKGIWKKGVRENAGAKGLGSHHRTKRGIYAKKGKSILAIEGRKRGGADICGRPVEKRVHPTFKIAPDITSALVAKKDGTQRMVQDYRHINQWMIKNGYPLPLIADILDGVGKRKVFTKLDLRWGYNNVRIKEGDEWKAAFTMHIGAYEPTVMYFGLTNSPATFQTMMNDLFRDLINQGDAATFIDDILVATDIEEGHDELVEEVLRRLEENDLFVKPEKCRWKVREVEFLGVVIGPRGVEMQKEKVDGVLN